MNPRILIGILAVGYAGWSFYNAWSADALEATPSWRLFLWGAMLALGVTVIVRSLKQSGRSSD